MGGHVGRELRVTKQLPRKRLAGNDRFRECISDLSLIDEANSVELESLSSANRQIPARQGLCISIEREVLLSHEGWAQYAEHSSRSIKRP